MESFIIYLVLALFAIFSGIKNYQKEKAKQKERVKDILSQPIPSIKPYEDKDDINTPVIPSNDLEGDYDDEKHNSIYSTTSENIYNNKEIESILARVQEYSDSDERKAFYIESEDENVINRDNKSLDLALNTPEDYRRAFIHTLIFDRKY